MDKKEGRKKYKKSKRHLTKDYMGGKRVFAFWVIGTVTYHVYREGSWHTDYEVLKDKKGNEKYFCYECNKNIKKQKELIKAKIIKQKNRSVSYATPSCGREIQTSTQTTYQCPSCKVTDVITGDYDTQDDSYYSNEEKRVYG